MEVVQNVLFAAKNAKYLPKNLHILKKSTTFARFFDS